MSETNITEDWLKEKGFSVQNMFFMFGRFFGIFDGETIEIYTFESFLMGAYRNKSNIPPLKTVKSIDEFKVAYKFLTDKDI